MITAKRAGIPFPLLASLLSSLVSGFHFAVSYQWVQNMNGERRRGRIVSTKTHFLWKYLHKFCWIHYFLFISPWAPAETLQVAIFLPDLTRNSQVMSPALLSTRGHSAERNNFKFFLFGRGNLKANEKQKEKLFVLYIYLLVFNRCLSIISL